MAQPTKTIKFEPDVLEVLNGGMTWTEEDGKVLGVIIAQLDRKLYVRVDKALKAAGGKWNRSKKAHVFDKDPRTQLEDIVDNGEVVVVKDGWFPTPWQLAKKLIDTAPPPRWSALILEPSAGEGALLEALYTNYDTTPHMLYACELNDDRRDILNEKFPSLVIKEPDFMKWHPGERFDRIYMNPPFEIGQDIEHVSKAYSLLASRGTLVAIMSEGVFFRGDRKATQFREFLTGIGGVVQQISSDFFTVSTRLVTMHKEQYDATDDDVAQIGLPWE